MTDKELLDKLDRLICCDDTISIYEEDGGCIVSHDSYRVQNNYCGATLREALTELLTDVYGKDDE